MQERAAEPPERELDALRAIVAGTAHATGEAFFQTLVRHLAAALGVRYALVAEFLTPGKLFIFRIFANRAAAELERVRAEQRLAESERRFRDLYEEAPIAYIHEGVDSRFVSANRAACQLLGLRPDEVRGTYGVSLIPP